MLNKGAMFGLFRALRKQSGGLFLAKRHSVASQETRGSIKTNRGAMFGLDARIALAIFGALSVISGAALYSAIQQARVTSLLAEMNELGKAVESYMLDTGTNAPLWKTDGSNNFTINYQELVTSSVAGWNGPYFPEPAETSDTYRYDHKIYESGHLYYLEPNTTWGEDVAWNAHGCGNASFTGICNIWTFISLVDKEIVKALDKQVDNADGGKNGNLKYTYPSGAAADAKWHVFYKVTQKM